MLKAEGKFVFRVILYTAICPIFNPEKFIKKAKEKFGKPLEKMSLNKKQEKIFRFVVEIKFFPFRSIRSIKHKIMRFYRHNFYEIIIMKVS